MLRALALCFALIVGMGATNAAHALRNDVLIIVNDNSTDSPQVGQYYAEQRGIEPGNVVHVRTPNQFTISWTEFQSLRDQILRFGICAKIDPSARPAACQNTSLPIYTDANVRALTALSPIRYIVLTRGVPTKMNVDGSTIPEFPGDPAALDNYLRFWLTRYFSADVQFNFIERTIALGANSMEDWRRRIRTVDTPTDLEYVIGRIDGLDLTSAKALVDRTLQAEAQGYFGKLYMHQEQLFYPWRYAFGMFNEVRSECADDALSTHYLKSSETSAAGKTPQHCLVKVTKADVRELMPGQASSRQPLVDNAVTYFGDMDGQAVQGGFSTLLNWRKNTSCTSTLCATAADPAACTAASIDPFKEIDTRCVGMADGFMGFNHISWPLAGFGSWPTGWGPVTTSVNDVPRVDSTTGADDSSSLWFDKPDEPTTAMCYPYANGVLGTTLTACRSRSYLGLLQPLSTSGIDPANPQPYRLTFQFKGQSLAAQATLRASLIISFQKPATVACPSGTSPNTPVGPTACIYTATKDVPVSNTTTWQLAELAITPAAFAGSPGINFFYVQLISLGGSYVGKIGLDTISVKRESTGVELVTNGSFTGGHLQSSDGDFAANFLSRMGGVAFWGSATHHGSSGHSFQGFSVRTLAFLQRGLPLGDAVWLGETRNGGLLYGDPLYSPMGVYIAPFADPDSRFAGTKPLGVRIRQGHPSLVKHVLISACPGRDVLTLSGTSPIAPLRCDRGSGWKNIPGLERTVGGDVTTFATAPEPIVFTQYGDYTLRMQVTTTNPASGEQQTFNDYYPIKYRYSDAELSVYTISGRLLTRTGQPLADAPVGISSSGTDPTTVYTDVTGRFRLAVRAGTYTVRPSYAGCTFTPDPATMVVSTSNVTQDIQCSDTGGRIVGTVTDSAGKPVPGVIVAIGPSHGAHTNTNGEFESPSLPNGTYAVQYVLNGWTIPNANVVVQGTRVTANAIATVGSPKLSGNIRNAQGNPIPGAYVSGADVVYSAANRDGFFEQGVPAAGTYDVTAVADGYVTQNIQLTANAAPVTITLVPAPLNVSGFITSGDTTASGYTVRFTAAGVTKETTSSLGGFYQMSGLTTGTYTMVVLHPSSGAQVGTPRSVQVSSNDLLNVDYSIN